MVDTTSITVDVNAAISRPSYIVDGSWSAISSVNNAATVNGVSHPNYAGVTDPRNIFVPWSGGLWDPVRKKMVINGGGHNDSDDNSWVQWEASGNTPNGFSLLRPPSNPPPIEQDSSDPVSVHSYGLLVYDPVVDRYLRFAGATAVQGDSTSLVWSIHPTTGVATLRASIPGATDVELDTGAAYDSVSDRSIYRGDTAAVAYDNGTNTYGTVDTGLIQASASGSTTICAIDPVRRLFFMHRRDSSYVYDIDSSGRLSGEQAVVFSSSMTGTQTAGMVYDPTNAEFISYSTAGDIYTIDPGADPTTTWTVTLRASGGPLSAEVDYQGHYGRFQLDNSWRALFFCEDESANMSAYGIDW